MDRADLLNSFRPASEVDDPQLFAGRQAQIEELADALHMIGSVPIIYGHRGLGKSSLALQMRRIAMGDVELLARRGSANLGLSAEQAFLTFYVTCTDTVSDIRALLQSLVNAMESIEFASESDGQARQLVDKTNRKKITIKFFEIESTSKYESERGRLSYQDLSLEEKVVQLAEIISEAYKQPILFIIDELDRMKNTTGIASLIKATSTDRLKFLLVGIGSSIADLLADHQSLERQLVPVHIPTMTRIELEEIVLSAEHFLKERGYDHDFSDKARRLLARMAAGFPWFVHVLGQAALTHTARANRNTVEREDVIAATSSLVNNRFAQQFSDMYQNAVRDSMARETVLRAFALWPGENIPTSDVYRILKDDLEVTNPSAYRGHLSSAEYGSIIFSPAFQTRGLVRFRNQMFKIYIKLRQSIFADVDDRVQGAYDEK